MLGGIVDLVSSALHRVRDNSIGMLPVEHRFERRFEEYVAHGIKICCAGRVEQLDPKFARKRRGCLDKLFQLYYDFPEHRPNFDAVVLKKAKDLFISDSGVTLNAMIEDLGVYAPDKSKVDAALCSTCVELSYDSQPSERQIEDAKHLGVPQDVIDRMVQGNLARRLGSWDNLAKMGLECAEKHASSRAVILEAANHYEERVRKELPKWAKRFQLNPDDVPEVRRLKSLLWTGNPDWEYFVKITAENLAWIHFLRGRYGRVKPLELPRHCESGTLSVPSVVQSQEKPRLDLRTYEIYFSSYFAPLENFRGFPGIDNLSAGLSLGLVPPPIAITTAVRTALRDEEYDAVKGYLQNLIKVCEAVKFADSWATSYFYWALAETHKQVREFGEARKVLTKAIELFPRDWIILRDYGHISHVCGDYPAAIKSAETEYNLALNGFGEERFGYVLEMWEGLLLAQSAQNAASSHCRYSQMTGTPYSSTFTWLEQALNVVEWSPRDRSISLSNILSHQLERELQEGEFQPVKKNPRFVAYQNRLRTIAA